MRSQILCTLASADEGKAAWLHTAGVLRLLERLTLLRAELDAEPGALDSPAEGLSLRVRKQVRPRSWITLAGSCGQTRQRSGRSVAVCEGAAAARFMVQYDAAASRLCCVHRVGFEARH